MVRALVRRRRDRTDRSHVAGASAALVIRSSGARSSRVWRYMDYNFKSGSPIEKLNAERSGVGRGVPLVIGGVCRASEGRIAGAPFFVVPPVRLTPRHTRKSCPDRLACGRSGRQSPFVLRIAHTNRVASRDRPRASVRRPGRDATMRQKSQKLKGSASGHLLRLFLDFGGPRRAESPSGRSAVARALR